MSELNTGTRVSMNQLPDSTDIPAYSPLHTETAKTCGEPHNGVSLSEQGLLTHIVIRGDYQKIPFAEGIKRVLGMELPETLQSNRADHRTLLWVSPDEWLLLAPKEQAFSLETELRQALSGQHYSVVNVSGGQTLLNLSGIQAQQVLKKSTPYDVHNRQFPVGKVVSSVFAKSQAMIYRLDETTWQLIVRRSFADYIWLWLSDAMEEFRTE